MKQHVVISNFSIRGSITNWWKCLEITHKNDLKPPNGSYSFTDTCQWCWSMKWGRLFTIIETSSMIRNLTLRILCLNYVNTTPLIFLNNILIGRYKVEWRVVYPLTKAYVPSVTTCGVSPLSCSILIYLIKLILPVTVPSITKHYTCYYAYMLESIKKYGSTRTYQVLR